MDWERNREHYAGVKVRAEPYSSFRISEKEMFQLFMISDSETGDLLDFVISAASEDIVLQRWLDMPFSPKRREEVQQLFRRLKNKGGTEYEH